MNDEDYCYECQGYGDDYFINDNGELECYCSQCAMNPNNWDDGYWIGDD
jgi:hypothetical protein